MALKIRLQRHGAAHEPVYRMVVAESTNRRDGRFVEVLGTYKPKARGQETELQLNIDRADYWQGVGAKPTDTARSLIRHARRGIGTEPAGTPAPPANATTTTAPEAAAPTPEAPAPEAPAPETASAEAAPEAAATATEPAPAPSPREAETTPAEEVAAAGDGDRQFVINLSTELLLRAVGATKETS